MAEYIGYSALAISLISISMTNMQRFRVLHLIASCIYVIYGLMIDAMPLVIGASLFSIIHCFKLYKLLKIKHAALK